MCGSAPLLAGAALQPHACRLHRARGPDYAHPDLLLSGAELTTLTKLTTTPGDQTHHHTGRLNSSQGDKLITTLGADCTSIQIFQQENYPIYYDLTAKGMFLIDTKIY